MRFGKPLDFSRYEGLENDRFILRSITDEIMYEIMRLSGQEYVDIYASRAKALDKESKKPAADPGAAPDRTPVPTPGAPSSKPPDGGRTAAGEVPDRAPRPGGLHRWRPRCSGR